MKKSIYLETSFISYLTASPSRDVVIAGHQAATHEWWEKRRQEFELYLSEVVIAEAQRGDVQAVAARLAITKSLPLLEVNARASELTKCLLKHKAVPEKAIEDAAHIAIACVHGMDYLLTWNCKHIANAESYKAIERVCESQHYDPPVICTPTEFLGD